MALSEKSVALVAESLKNSHDNGHKVCLLIGAGVSITAGIPTSNGFVEKIAEKFPVAYGELENPDYNSCMSQLENAQQVELISEYIKAAKINKAHIGIARLEKNEIIDTILTTNFDPLASRACALFNQFPAIYDLANLGDKIEFDFSYVSGSAIFHLHGQHTGFRQFNDKAKLEAQAARIQPVLQAVMKGKPVIIAGYSGENDPLIDEIVKLAPFNHGLYWICHNDKNPTQSVCDKLLSLDGCHIVRNMPADKFFDELANALELPPPEFLAKPFDHMLGVLGTLQRADEKDKNPDNALLKQAIDQLKAANSNRNTKNVEISLLYSLGNYEEIWKRFNADKSLDRDSKNLVAWSATILGISLANRAKTISGDEADDFFDQSYKKFEQSLSIKPNDDFAVYNWAITLKIQARTKRGQASYVLLESANQKFKAVVNSNPSDHEALINWGDALLAQAETKYGDKIDFLFNASFEKYELAISIKPDKHEAVYNWGVALLSQAETKQGEEAFNLLELAKKRFEAAILIKPDKQEAFYNWGVVLSIQARTKQGDEAYSLFQEARKKFELALIIKPYDFSALMILANILAAQALIKNGNEADLLFNLSFEKYEMALNIEPNDFDALNNYGVALRNKAETRKNTEADHLLVEATKKLRKALNFSPDSYQVLNNLGEVLLLRSRTDQTDQADKLRDEALHKLLQAENLKPGSAAYNIACIYGLAGNVEQATHWLKTAKDKDISCLDCDHISKDTDFDFVRNTSEFKQALIDIGCG